METLSYEQFLAFMRTNWKLSEHIGVIAPTGSGKSYIVRDLLNMKRHAIVIATKARDKTLDKYIKEDGFYRISKWPPEWYQSHVLFWRKAQHLGDVREQQIAIYGLMDDVYQRGGYVLYFDDLYFVAITLNLKSAIQMMYTQVRSNGVSLIASMQRPRWVPLEAVSQATYLLVFRIRDDYDIERTAQGMGLSKGELRAAIQELGEFEFLLLQSGKDPIRIQRRPA